MDPVQRMRNRFSQGRRSSVDPIRCAPDDSCLMLTEEKRPRSGIPRMVAPSGSKRRSSSTDRTRSIPKFGYDYTVSAGSSAGLLFTPQNPTTPRVSVSARKAIDCISQLSAKSHTARKDQRTALDKNAQLRHSRHVAAYLNKTGLVGDLLAGGQVRAPSGPIQSSDLKNMNKGAFITLFNLLYKTLGSRRKVDFNSSNFQESIPVIAKKLGYPGVIYKSHLLTPNTSHSWPYIIAFLGWLVDLVEWQHPFGVALESRPETEALAVKEFYMSSYAAYLNEEIQEPSEESIKEFRSVTRAIRNTQTEIMEEIMERRNEIKAIVDVEDECSNSLKQQTEKINAEVQDSISKIENLQKYNASKNTEITAIKAKIIEDGKKKEMLISKLEQLRKEKESLKTIYSQQVLSKPQWNQLVAENKAIREENQMLAEICEQKLKIVDNLDLKMSSISNKLNKVWFEVVESSLLLQADSADVSHLMMLIQNFNRLRPEAQRCLEDILKILECALTKTKSKVAEDQAKAKSMQDKSHETSITAEKIRKKRDQVIKEVKIARNELKLTGKRLKEEEDEWNKNIQEVQQQIKHMKESPPNVSNTEREKIKEMHGAKKDRLEVTKQQYAKCLGDMQEMTESYIKISLEQIVSFQEEAGAIQERINKFMVGEKNLQVLHESREKLGV